MKIDSPTLIREATRADATAIGTVHAAAWQTAHRDVFETDWLTKLAEQRRTRWTDVLTAREFARTTLLVAEHGDHIAAFTHVGPHRDQPRDAELYDLYVHPSLWGRGLATALLDAAWDRLADAGYPRTRVWTLAGATRARALYTRFGFTLTERTRERDHGDGRPVLEIEYARAVHAVPAPRLPGAADARPTPRRPAPPHPPASVGR
ncbi:MAG TPA: GNAT family N-acetyltransferase [Actinophytocola sp.]|uniref:GNAT family N-acetyltransferase n=1 Tax=Actinophytocola sp. TaxID=1872138 RepID=UPI002DDD65C7|nr:GNAT family N-acetyltransferase [Actinophytocola sp.]HEV2779469.1 GNAT family N-acetyltransferase [Actinophytocola sp.]